MERYGLVLAGGGAKGAYQIGAWRALREMGIRFDAIAGVSIGSINGALIAADDYDKAVEMWDNVSLHKGINLSSSLPDPENLLSKKNWNALFRELLKNGGIDASPLGEFIGGYIDEEKVRKSLVDFGIITVQVSQGINNLELFLEDIPRGELVDYLLASSNVPFVNNIGPEGEKYLDGGAYDNIPVMTLKKRGYNRLIVIDISNIKGVGHSFDMLNSTIVYIRPYDLNDLGGFMDFDSKTNERRMRQGYLDAKKAFSELMGRVYCFLPSTFRSMVIKYGADTVLQLEELAHRLGVPQLDIYTAESFLLAVKNAYGEYLLSLEQREEAEKKETEKKLRARRSEKGEDTENDISSRFSELRRRFGTKRITDDYPKAVECLEKYSL